MKRIIGLLFTVILLFGTFGSNALAQTPVENNPQDLTYYFRRSWGGEGDQIHHPVDLAKSEQGLLYIVLRELNRVLIFDPSQSTFRSFGGFGVDPGQFDMPVGVDVGSNGKVYIADAGNQRIQVFDPDGQFLYAWGSVGSQPGQFNTATGIAIDSIGDVYVTDSANNRVQKFNSDGNFILQWQRPADNLERLNSPAYVYIDQEDDVYVVDHSGFFIERYTNSGSFIDEFGEYGLEEDKFRNICGVTTDNLGNVFALDCYTTSKVKVFNPDHIFLRQWEILNIRTAGSGNLLTDNGNQILVACDTLSYLPRYTASGTLITYLGSLEPDPNSFDRLEGIAESSTGSLVVADTFNRRIVEYNLDGTPSRTVTHINSANNLPFAPTDLAFDSDGNAYVTDQSFGKVYKFYSDWIFSTQWGVKGENQGQMMWPTGIAVDSEKNVYVVDTFRRKVLKYNSAGDFLLEWGDLVENGGQFSFPMGVDIDQENFLYIADSNRGLILKFSGDGAFIRSYGTPGTGAGSFSGPQDVVVDNAGNLTVAEKGNQRIQIINQGEESIVIFGSPGSATGQFRDPISVVKTMDGDVYAVDQGNLRIQQFTLDPPPNDPYSGLIQNGGIENQLNEWTYWGDIGDTPVSLSLIRMQGNYSMLLGESVPQIEQGISKSWAYTNFFIDPNWERPVLTFNYKMQVNDNMHYSDFLVAVQYGVGLSHVATVVRDGYLPCTGNYAPRPGRDLGWRTGSYDLSAFKGQHVRVVFSNRNLWPDSLGIWTNVDNVRVLDAGPIPPAAGLYRLNLPLIGINKCDIPDYGLQGGIERLVNDQN